MNRFLLFIFGSLRFKATGGFVERFLNLCNARGVKLHSLKIENGVLYAETSLSSFRKIRKCASGSSVKIKILQKKGLPFIYSKIADRKGLFIGVALSVFFLFFYSRCVWSIEVTGNEKISEESIISVLSENSVKEGILKSGIDTKKLSFILYDEIPEISWLNIGIDGSRLTVNIREVTQKPKSRDSESYCNIVASADGVVDKIRVYEGQAMVSEGDGVSEGELLVSGIIFHEQAKLNTFHRSSADIWANTKAKKQIKISKQTQKQVFTGREKTLKTLKIFRFKIPLYLFSPGFKSEEKSVNEKPIILGSKKLPISLIETAHRETATKTQKLNKTGALSLARLQKSEFEKSLTAGTKIKKCTLKSEEKESEFIFTYFYELYENIAKFSEIEIDEKNVDNNIEKED